MTDHHHHYYTASESDSVPFLAVGLFSILVGENARPPVQMNLDGKYACVNRNYLANTQGKVVGCATDPYCSRQSGSSASSDIFLSVLVLCM